MSKNKVVNSKMFFTHLFNHILLVLNTHCILLYVSHLSFVYGSYENN